MEQTQVASVGGVGSASATTFNGGGNGVSGSVSSATRFNEATEGSNNPSISNITAGYKWGGSTFGASIALTYSFSAVNSTYGYSNTDTAAVTALVANQISGAVQAMAAFSNVANISYSQVTDTASSAGDIRWNNSGNTDLGTAYAYYPTTLAQGGDIWFGPNYTAYQNPVVGGYGYLTFLHELGHAMGLNHPHDGITPAVAHEDQLKYSVMSYRAYDGQPVDAGYSTAYYPTTLMLNDIAAIQFLYGVNTSYRSGDDTWSWAANTRVFETIWDGGGNDTLSAASQSQGSSLYLTSGKWSQIGAAFSNGQTMVRDNLTIAYGAVIENAIGSAFADTIEGNAVANSLMGGGGNDSIDGVDGNDTLQGGAGNDALTGGSGNDTADYASASAGVTAELWRGTASNDGQGGADTLNGIENLSGSGFNDLLAGNEAANSLSAQDGNDTIFAGGGADTLLGNNGDDWLAGGAGNDTISGAAGIDTADYASASAGVVAELWRGTASNDGQGGNDVLSAIENLNGGNFNDLLAGNEAANLLAAGAGNDSLFAGGGNDTLQGGNGNDILVGGAGQDSINGGTGTDTADYAAATGAVTAELWRGTASNDGQGSNDLLVGIENLVGGNFNDLLAGDEGSNNLNGAGGNDSFFGGGGADGLQGGDGNDWLAGGAGNDTITGGSGVDTADYAAATSAVTAELWRGTASNDGQGGQDVLSAVENLNGSQFNDLLAGTEAANLLVGGAGNDVLYGAGGADSLLGGNGNDVVLGGAGSDSLDGGAGIDTVDYASAGVGVVVELWRNSATNDGQAGADVVLNFENLNGGGFNDFLVGNEGSNIILGALGNDTVYAGGGDDVLIGGGGNDSLHGGAGRDTFRFDTAPNSATNLDRLADFVVLDDSIALSQSVFAALGSGTLAAGKLLSGAGVASAQDGDDFILYDSSSGALYYDADANGGGVAIQFAILPTGLNLNASNFLVG